MLVTSTLDSSSYKTPETMTDSFKYQRGPIHNERDGRVIIDSSSQMSFPAPNRSGTKSVFGRFFLLDQPHHPQRNLYYSRSYSTLSLIGTTTAFDPEYILQLLTSSNGVESRLIFPPLSATRTPHSHAIRTERYCFASREMWHRYDRYRRSPVRLHRLVS